VKRKIIVLQPEYSFGGLEKQTILLVDYLVRKGWNTTVISQKPGLMPRVEKKAGMMRIYLPFYSSNYPSLFVYVVLSTVLIGLLVLFRRVKIVHSQLSLRSIFVASLSRILFGAMFGVKASDSFMDDELNMGIRKFFPLFRRSIDLFVVLSEKMRRRLMALGVENAKINIIRIGVEDFLVDKSVSLYRRVQNIENGMIRMIYAGRLSSEKCVDKLIYACASLREKQIDFILKIVGDGPEANKLIKLVSDLHLRHNVCFLGFLPLNQVYEQMRESDVFVLPSRTEGLPNALIEAMALGLIVIATPVGDIDEIIKHGDNGFLLQSNDAQEIEKILMDLLQKSEQVMEVCTKAVETVNKNLMLSKSLELYNKMFEKILQSTSSEDEFATSSRRRTSAM